MCKWSLTYVYFSFIKFTKFNLPSYCILLNCGVDLSSKFNIKCRWHFARFGMLTLLCHAPTSLFLIGRGGVEGRMYFLEMCMIVNHFIDLFRRRRLVSCYRLYVRYKVSLIKTITSKFCMISLTYFDSEDRPQLSKSSSTGSDLNITVTFARKIIEFMLLVDNRKSEFSLLWPAWCSWRIFWIKRIGFIPMILSLQHDNHTED